MYHRRSGVVWGVLLVVSMGLSACQHNQSARIPFYFGVDLSYVNEMEDCGAVYLEDGKPQDPFKLFHNRGANLARARLWHDPTWTDYSTLADVTKTFERARQAGMLTLLDIHYSDEWADPGKQNIPAAWEHIEDEDELAQAVYQYTYDVLMVLYQEGVMPAFVQVGNETNAGMLKRIVELDWPRDAKLFNAGIKAVRDVAEKTNTDPKIILHIAQPENTGWWFREAQEHGIADFDVIGISYYPQWSDFSIADMGGHVTYLRQTFGKDVMVVETAYPWTFEGVSETAGNILNKGVRGYPTTIAGQRQFLIDLAQSLIGNGALGIVYWEPAWVSTRCSTRWGLGSHWENATFFDFRKGNELHEGIDFLRYPYTFPSVLADGVVQEAYGEALSADALGDHLGQDAALDLISLHATEDNDFIAISLTVAGDVYADQGASYLLYFDTTNDAQGAGADVGRRPLRVADPFKPEYCLDVRIIERKDTMGGSYSFYAWDGETWQEITLTGGAAIRSGVPSIIEIQIPKAALGDPHMINIGAVSTDRGRTHTAADILGIDISPSDWSEPVVLDTFGRLDLELVGHQ
ncbi:MAG: arabinogalactan endo-1,4-beta-galactosidase [Anaerolineae bacterium]|nr:arabinogalactan endo-1,4-beta-galactosidase [Anaerolineae bacterium]